MKRKLSLICAVCAVLILVLSSLAACSVPTDGSIKSITKPYIAEYECVEARLGNLDLLEKYDYITITLLEKSEMLVSFKPKNGEKKSFKGEYTITPETREFTGTAGIFGAPVKETVKIENGSFTITRTVLATPLILKFRMK